MKKKKSVEVKFETKHIKVKIILFVVATLVAVAGFSYGIYSLSNSRKGKTGWNTYSLEADAKYPFYYQNVYLQYYYDSGEITSKESLVKSLFHLSSKSIYSLIDSNKENESKYKDVKGLAYINNHPNEKIEIEETLYDILVDAKAKTDEVNSTYSLFSGYLNDYWGYYMNSTNYQIKEQFISDMVELINTKDNFTLNLEKEQDKYYCTYSYSQDVQKAIDDYELSDVSALDLNTLFYSYYLDSLYKKFNSGGLTKGVLYTHTGESIYMYGGFNSGNSISLYDYYGEKPFVYATYNETKQCAVSNIRTFPTYEEYEAEFRFKLVENSTTWSTRTMYYSSITGYSSDKIKSSTAIVESNNGTLADATYMNLNYVNGEDITKTSTFTQKATLFALKGIENSIVYMYNAANDLSYIEEPYKENNLNNV